MWSDVEELSEFYAGSTGQVARHLIRRQLRALWPRVRGDVVLGLGYATPYLRQFREEAERVIAFMPTRQGVVHWPAEGPYAAALVEETALPLANYSVDRVLLVHGLEHSDGLRETLGEVWRVLKGEGELLIVVPNRRGVWARLDRTPFGHGRPFSPTQLTRLLRENRFTPLETRRALFVPPIQSRWLLRTAAAWERLGGRWFPQVAGVIVVSAKKQIYAPRANTAKQASRRALTLPLPVAAGKPAPAGRQPRSEG